LAVRVYEDRDQLAAAAAAIVVAAFREKRNRLLLAGGATAGSVYDVIARTATAADYKGAHLFFVDERVVPPDHLESHYGMVKRAWLAPVRFPTERVHRIPAELGAERAARLAEEELRSVAGEPPHVHLALLNLGRDGRTASLFPESDELDETDRLYLPARGGSRVTASFALLQACEQVLFVVSGRERAEAVHAALNEPPGAVPASLVGSPDRPPLWLLDRSAAALLS
jgi:6-phosphogluconolactonase